MVTKNGVFIFINPATWRILKKNTLFLSLRARKLSFHWRDGNLFFTTGLLR